MRPNSPMIHFNLIKWIFDLIYDIISSVGFLRKKQKHLHCNSPKQSCETSKQTFTRWLYAQFAICCLGEIVCSSAEHFVFQSFKCLLSVAARRSQGDMEKKWKTSKWEKESALLTNYINKHCTARVLVQFPSSHKTSVKPRNSRIIHEARKTKHVYRPQTFGLRSVNTFSRSHSALAFRWPRWK